MHLAWKNLTISRVTKSDIGTIFANKRIQVPKFAIQISNELAGVKIRDSPTGKKSK